MCLWFPSKKAWKFDLILQDYMCLWFPSKKVPLLSQQKGLNFWKTFSPPTFPAEYYEITRLYALLITQRGLTDNKIVLLGQKGKNKIHTFEITKRCWVNCVHFLELMGFRGKKLSFEGSWWVFVGSWWVFVGSWWVSVGSWWVSVGSWWVFVGSWWVFVGNTMCTFSNLVDSASSQGKMILHCLVQVWSCGCPYFKSCEEPSITDPL